MNYHDVITSKGKESLKRLHANALALLDLAYTRDDLALLLEEARRGLEQKSISKIQESLDLFAQLLDFQPLSLEVLEPNVFTSAASAASGEGAFFPPRGSATFTAGLGYIQAQLSSRLP